MKRFSDCLTALEIQREESGLLDVLSQYLGSLNSLELAWAVYFLSGRKLNSGLKAAHLRQTAQELSSCSNWLFEACYEKCGDLIETISLILPQPEFEKEIFLGEFAEDSMLQRDLTASAKSEFLRSLWNQLGLDERFYANKILTDSFRSPVSMKLLLQALSQVTGVNKFALAAYMETDWQAKADFLNDIPSSWTDSAKFGPYPFVESRVLTFGTLKGDKLRFEEAICQWEWKGLKAQLVKRSTGLILWGEDGVVLNRSFPEIIEDAGLLPDGMVLEGYVLPFKEADLMPAEALQKRVDTKKPAAKLLAEIPVVFMLTDLFEDDGRDLRRHSALQRRERLEFVLSNRSKYKADEFEQLSLFAPCRLQLSPILRLAPRLAVQDLRDLSEKLGLCRSLQAKGVLLRSSSLNAESGSLIVNAEPLRASLVLVAVREGFSKTASCILNLAAWKADELVSVVWLEAELSEADRNILQDFVRENTLRRHGDLSLLKAELVFDLEFDDLLPSSRHKSGLQLSCPRLRSLNLEKTPKAASKVDELKAAAQAQLYMRP